jgi:hypothetical protein
MIKEYMYSKRKKRQVTNLSIDKVPVSYLGRKLSI